MTLRTLRRRSEKESLLTERRAPSKLIDGRLWHAVRQHAGELDRKTARHNLLIHPPPRRGQMITTALNVIQNFKRGARRNVGKKYTNEGATK